MVVILLNMNLFLTNSQQTNGDTEITSMSVKLTKSPAVCQWNWLSPCTRSSAEKRITPMGTYFAARESQHPGAQLRYIFFLYTRFHLIPPNSMGDLARKSWVRFHKKLIANKSHGVIFRRARKPIPRCTTTIYILPLYKVSFDSSQ